MSLSARRDPARRTRPRMALAALAIAATLGACAGKPTTATTDAGNAAAPPAPRPIGGDRDAHGCLPAAGYAWCARENRCVRPWELAKRAGFENTMAGFRRHCDATSAAPADGHR